MSAVTRHPHGENRLLAGLTDGDFALLAPHLISLPLPLGEMVAEAGQQIRFAYFPHTAVISLLITLSDGTAADSATIGSEGFVGLAGFLGADVSQTNAIVQVEGGASQIELSLLREAARASRSLLEALLRYGGALLQQLSQSVVCNRVHSVEQRAARWLLMTHDRARRDTFSMTHEFLADMLACIGRP